MKRKLILVWHIAITLIMVLSFGLVMAMPASADVGPTDVGSADVTNIPPFVSTAATYTIVFDVDNSDVTFPTGTIVLTFPAGTTVPAGTTAYNGKVTVDAGLGPVTCGTGKVTGVAATRIVTIIVPATITAGTSDVTVVILATAGIKNPATQAPDWFLYVHTSAETNNVESGSYATWVPPTLTPDITAWQFPAGCGPGDITAEHHEGLVPLGTTVSVGQYFLVKAAVINSGGMDADSANATLTKTGSANITCGDNPQLLGEIDFGDYKMAYWCVQCIGPGAITLTVTPGGTCNFDTTPVNIPAANLIAKTLNLTQQAPAALSVTALTSSAATVKVGGQFTVKATVKNIGTATATGVYVHISHSDVADVLGPHDMDVSPSTTLAANGTGTATFTVICTDTGPATFTVDAYGFDANSGEGICDESEIKTVTVAQTNAPVLEARIMSPKDHCDMDEVKVGSHFEVKAKVWNPGSSVAKGVTLTISIDANAALAPGETATKTSKNYQYLEACGNYDPDTAVTDVETEHWHWITWDLICTNPGMSNITVTPAGTDVLTNAAIPSGSLIADTVVVYQSCYPYSIDLHHGWNLISVPMTLVDSKVSTVFPNNECGGDAVDLQGHEDNKVVTKVYSYTGTAWQTAIYNPTTGTWSGTLTNIVPGKGYWVFCPVLEDNVRGYAHRHSLYLQIPDPSVAPPTYSLVAGWNLIGATTLNWDARGHGDALSGGDDHDIVPMYLWDYLSSLGGNSDNPNWKVVYGYGYRDSGPHSGGGDHVATGTWIRATPTNYNDFTWEQYKDFWYDLADYILNAVGVGNQGHEADPVVVAGCGYWVFLNAAGTLAP